MPDSRVRGRVYAKMKIPGPHLKVSLNPLTYGLRCVIIWNKKKNKGATNSIIRRKEEKYARSLRKIPFRKYK